MDEVEEILRIIREKGWNLYLRGEKGVKIADGPVDSPQENGAEYAILPRIKECKNEQAIISFGARHEIIPVITMPEGSSHPGHEIESLFGEEEFAYLIPGQMISFTRIEFLSGGVRLRAENQTYMSYPIFIKALESLPDITGLK